MAKKTPNARTVTRKPGFSLGGETGHHALTGHSAELVLHAQQVARALRNLPPGAPLAEADRDEIRRALSVLTAGQVGGFQFKLRDREKAKQNAWRKLKHYSEVIGDEAAKEVGKRLGEAGVKLLLELVRFVAYAEALNWLHH
jgi:hypothetical protein